MSPITTHGRRRWLLACLAGFAAWGVACGDTGGGGGSFGASIQSLEMQPDRLPKNKATGMTDQHFSIRLELTGFDAPVGAVELFVQQRENQTRTQIFRRPEGETDTENFFAVGSASCVDACSGGSGSVESCVHQQCDGTGNVLVSDDDVLFTLFSDFDPGVYEMGACVTSEESCNSNDIGTSVTQRGLKPIEITQ